MATIAQIEANRKNAQKSTGPTSDSGKEAVRFNALKSGIDAASIIIPGEDPDQFSKLAAGFTDSWQPANAAECELVDHLIEDSWRLRRLRAAESQMWTCTPPAPNSATSQPLPSGSSDRSSIWRIFFLLT